MNVYFPILDSFLKELNSRFNSRNLLIMGAIQACCPQSKNFLNRHCIQPLCDNYNLDYESLRMEAKLAKRTLSEKQMETMSDVLLEIQPLQEAFPTFAKVLHIALTISVSSSQCESSFSALKRIKSFLRSTMTESRLVDLAFLSIERNLSGSILLEEMIDKFLATGHRKIILL